MLIHATLWYIFPFIICLGITCGIISAYAVVRKLSFLGDIMSHAAFPGITITFLFLKTTSSFLLMTGGAAAAIISVLLAFIIRKKVYTPRDTLLSIILSLFFSVGILSLALIQKKNIPGHSILNNFLFGNLFTITPQEAGLGILLCIFITLLSVLSVRIQTLIAFDNEYAKLFLPYHKWWEIALLLCLIGVIVIGLQTVGLVLMGSLAIGPGAFARLIASSYPSMIYCAVLTGMLACINGMLLSLMFPSAPTGPLIVLSMTLPSILYALYRRLKVHYT